jgi:hypothetical protein
MNCSPRRGPAPAIGEADLQRLRDLGLSQQEIMDVILAAAARCFFSKALIVGRPIADGWNQAGHLPAPRAGRTGARSRVAGR